MVSRDTPNLFFFYTIDVTSVIDREIALSTNQLQYFFFPNAIIQM